MPREVKPGVFINCKVSTEIVDMLNAYSKRTRIPKTAIVEMALEQYLKDKSDSDIGTDAVPAKANRPK